MKLNKDRLRSVLKKRRQTNTEQATPVNGVATEEIMEEEAAAEKPIPAEDIAAGTIKDSSPSSDAAETVFTGVERHQR